MPPFFSRFFILWCFVAAAVFPVTAAAQQDAAAPEQPQQTEITQQELQRLLQTLEDPLAREAFLERLRTLAAVGDEVQPDEQTAQEGQGLGGSLLAVASEGIDEVSAQLGEIIVYLQGAPAVLNQAWVALNQPDNQRILFEIVGKIVGIFVVALLAGWLVRHLLNRPWEALRNKNGKSLVNRALLLLVSFVFRLIPLAVFAAVAYLVLPLLDPRPITRLVLLTLVNAHVLAQGVILVARTVLAVDTPALRPYRMESEHAAYCYIWVRRLTIVIVYGYFINVALLLVGLRPSVSSVLVDLTGLLVGLMFISLILQNRTGIANAIRGGPEIGGVMAQVRGTVAVLWHFLALAYVIGVYIVWAYEVEGGFAYLMRSTVATFVILALIRLVLSAAQRGIERLFQLPAHMREQYAGLEERANRYRPVVIKFFKAVITIVGILVILEAWGIDSLGFMTTGLGREIAARSIRLLLIVAFSFLLWEIVSALIEKRLRANVDTSRRMMTLLPLVKNLVRLVILVMGGMIALSEIGMDIGPLLAGAGVIGLAIGFGAQTLVKDLISGFFVVLEDIIAVGDWVEIGSHTGIVEGMSIRTIRLRDLNGNLRILPFGDVSSVHKVAPDYSYALFVVGVAYRENTDEVVDLICRVSEEMREDAEWGPKILEPLEVLGVNELGSSSVDIRVRIKCVPLEQWGVRREFLRRIKLLFDEKGIEIPFPHQTIYFGEDKDGKAPAASVHLTRDDSDSKK